jgi:acetylornithine aminotransferase
VQAGFGPLVEGFIRVPTNSIEAVRNATENNPNVVAVFFETIQGEGGVNPMHMQYLRDLRQLCDERNWLMMIDEVQCGMGRTGKWFAHQWAGILPDVMPLAKGLGSGVPIGAVVAGPKAATILHSVGNHLKEALEKSLACTAGVKEIRGQGLMLGIELDRPCGVLVQRAVNAGLLISVTADSVIRIVPPLILTSQEADEIVAILIPLIQALLTE